MRRGIFAVGLMLVIGVLSFSVITALAAPATKSDQIVPNTVTPLTKGATAIGSLPDTQAMSLTLTLQPRDPATLNQLVTAVANPRSPQFRHFITPVQFAQTFGPDAATRQAVEQFLASAGLRIIQVQSGGLAIHVSGTARQVAAAFHVAITTYRAPDGHTFFANDRNITLPAAIAPAIIGVAGLDTSTQFHPLSTPTATHQPPVVAANASCPGTGLTVPQLGAAYHFPQGINAARSGLALLELDGYQPSDIATFAACYAPGVNIANVVQPRLVDTATPLALGNGAIEDELDIEIALGLVPTLGQINVYEAPNNGNGWMDLLATIANDNADGTVSISWGRCEANINASYAASENVYFQQMVTQGQDVFAAAGDTGAYDCLPNDQSGSGNSQISADDPATNPNVVAVGGTSLHTNNGTYSSESVWNSYNGSGAYMATGGGYSQYWYSPSWQVSAHASSNSQSARMLPDIAADADPETQAHYYFSVSGLSAGWHLEGGTSAAAPTWASLATMANVLAGARTGLLTPALYALYGADAHGSGPAGITVGGTTYYDYAQQVNGAQPPGGAFVFHDIIAGNNGFPGFAAGYSAQRGFDMVSGLGSMNGQVVADYLAGLGTPVGPTPTPTNTPTATPPTNPTAGIYLAAQGTNGGYWVSSNLTQPPSLPYANGNWLMLDATPFQGAPAIVNGGNQNGGTFWVAGTGTDGIMHFGAWYPTLQQFSGWQAVPGVNCQGAAAATYAQGTLFVMCMTPQGSLYINGYNTVNNTWGGWGWIGSGLSSAPTLTTNGTTLLILAQAPIRAGDQSDWYTLYTIGAGTTTQWRRFMTTCETTPAVTYRGTTTSDYALACIADDTNSLWSNVFSVGTQSSSLVGWNNLGIPAQGNGFHVATAISSDSTSTVYYTGLGTDNAMYMTALPMNNQPGNISWQRLSLPGIFAANASTTYFGG